MRISRMVVVVAAGLVCGLAGCSNQKTEVAGGPVNAACPFTGQPVSASSVMVSYKGQNVAMCCNGCANRWAGMSDAEKEAKFASLAKK